MPTGYCITKHLQKVWGMQIWERIQTIHKLYFEFILSLSDHKSFTGSISLMSCFWSWSCYIGKCLAGSTGHLPLNNDYSVFRWWIYWGSKDDQKLNCRLCRFSDLCFGDEYLQTEGVGGFETHFDDYPSHFEKKKLVEKKERCFNSYKRFCRGIPSATQLYFCCLRLLLDGKR